MFIKKCAGRLSEAPLGARCDFSSGARTRSGHFTPTELEGVFSIRTINIASLAGLKGMARRRER
jgi:hypothetical protein